jgi:HD-like signal output (HDOD) protein
MPDQTSTTDGALYRILASIKQLPSPPEVCLAVTQATHDESTTLADLEALVESDIGLSSQLMQVANSAFFGVRESVTSVRRAISLLGFSTVRSLALGFFINEQFGKLRLPGLPYPDLPRYALANSVVAESIARRVDSAMADAAACLGLLHECGVMVMAMAFGTQYRRMVADMQRRPGRSLAEAESMLFGVDHVLAGKLLLKGWRLSDVFVETVGRHHDDHLSADTDPAAMAMWRVVRLGTEVAMLFFKVDDPTSLQRATQAATMTFQWSAVDLARAITDAAGLYEQRVIMAGINSEIVAADTQAAMHAAGLLLASAPAA